MRSQRIGQGFESPRLHQNPKDTAKSASFGFLRSRQGSELARNTSPVRASSLFFLAYKRAIYPCAQVRRRPQPTLSPFPITRDMSDIYGEAPLVTTCRDTAKSVSFGFLRSRQGSDPRVLGTLSVKENIYSNATRSEMKDPRAGSAACGAGRFRPSLSPGACRSIPPQRTAYSSPTLMAKFPSSPPS